MCSKNACFFCLNLSICEQKKIVVVALEFIYVSCQWMMKYRKRYQFIYYYICWYHALFCVCIMCLTTYLSDFNSFQHDIKRLESILTKHGLQVQGSFLSFFSVNNFLKWIKIQSSIFNWPSDMWFSEIYKYIFQR